MTETTQSDDHSDDERGVSRGFVLGLVVLGVLLFGLFVWVTLSSGGATPL